MNDGLHSAFTSIRETLRTRIDALWQEASAEIDRVDHRLEEITEEPLSTPLPGVPHGPIPAVSLRRLHPPDGRDWPPGLPRDDHAA